MKTTETKHARKGLLKVDFHSNYFHAAHVDLRLMIDIPLVEIDLIVNSGQFQPMECLECLSLIVNPRARVEIV